MFSCKADMKQTKKIEEIQLKYRPLPVLSSTLSNSHILPLDHILTSSHLYYPLLTQMHVPLITWLPALAAGAHACMTRKGPCSCTGTSAVPPNRKARSSNLDRCRVKGSKTYHSGGMSLCVLCGNVAVPPIFWTYSEHLNLPWRSSLGGYFQSPLSHDHPQSIPQVE